jgi:hypothetical protein
VTSQRLAGFLSVTPACAAGSVELVPAVGDCRERNCYQRLLGVVCGR